MNEKTPAPEAGAAAAEGVVKVLFPLPLPKPYDYRAPGPLAPGTFVEAPFGGRRALGVVWPGAPENVAPEKLKSISAVIDAPPLSAAMIDFLGWVAGYTMFPLGAVLRLTMRSGSMLRTPKGDAAFEPAGAPPARMTPPRRAVLDFLSARQTPASLAAITEATGAGAAPARLADTREDNIRALTVALGAGVSRKDASTRSSRPARRRSKSS